MPTTSLNDLSSSFSAFVLGRPCQLNSKPICNVVISINRSGSIPPLNYRLIILFNITIFSLTTVSSDPDLGIYSGVLSTRNSEI